MSEDPNVVLAEIRQEMVFPHWWDVGRLISRLHETSEWSERRDRIMSLGSVKYPYDQAFADYVYEKLGLPFDARKLWESIATYRIGSKFEPPVLERFQKLDAIRANRIAHYVEYDELRERAFAVAESPEMDPQVLSELSDEWSRLYDEQRKREKRQRRAG